MKRSMALALLPLTLGFAFACGEDDPPASEPKRGTGGSGGEVTGGYAGMPETQAGAGGEAGDGEGGTSAGRGGSGGGGGSAGTGAAGSAGSGGTKGGLPGGKFGYFPEDVTTKDAEVAYESWKEEFVLDCGVNGLSVSTDGAEQSLSEAITFGALLAVAWDDQETFDGLYKYYRKAGAVADSLKGGDTAFMGWFVGNACEFGEVYPGASIGSDLNMAMALMQAECRWGGEDYLEAATRIAETIRDEIVVEVDGRLVLLPTDTSPDGTCWSPSYGSPAYYRVFAQAMPEDAELWEQLADDTYVLLEKASHPTTGLAPDWAPNGKAACPEATGYVGYDGIRTLWRVATDYNWFGTKAAKTWLDRVTNYMDGEVGVDRFNDIKDGFFIDGEGMLIATGLGNSAFVGAFAVGSIATSQDASDSFHQALLDLPSTNDASYYTETARALYLLLSINEFSPGCYD